MNMIVRESQGSPALRYYDHGGQGSILLLLHGVTRCGADWEPLLATLTASWHVMTVDQRGHGGSARAQSYLVTDYVADAIRLIRDELCSPLTIFGHSLGAMVAAAVGGALPQLVEALVLEDPPFQTMGNRIAGSAWQAQFLGMRKITRQGGSVEELTEALTDIRLPNRAGRFTRLGDLRDRASLNWSAQCLSQLDAEVLTPVIDGRWLEGYDPTTILSAIRCPTLLLQADPNCGGALTDDDAALTVAANFSSCQRVCFQGCGHQLHRDRTQEVLQTLHDFRCSISLRE